MKHRLIFATNNRYKADEVQSLLPPDFEVITLHEAGIVKEIPEPYPTLEENAATKATTIFTLVNEDCFAEDTGLEVAALDGAPGVRSARFAGEHARAEENITLLLQQLQPHENRTARFRTVIHLIKNGKAHTFEGICNGSIAKLASGNKGFGYDPVFIPEGSERCFAEMTMEEKNRFSHRRKALDAMLIFLHNMHESNQT
ncbi:MAG: RdgB/HAM1 family non-canonical purine NTP pyrophosphatase [Chitinophagaceae bacterium]